MQDVFYIVVTVIFGLFVLFLCFLTWRSLRIKLDINNLSDDEREIIYAFCKSSKQSTI
jgi:hypothetical protein